MNKKAIFICSSPNKNGNTNKTVKLVDAELKIHGVETEVIDIANLKYKVNGCVACMSCQKSDKYECAFQDDAIPLYKKIKEVNFLIFATPIYFFGPNAQLKLILDRMFCLYKIDKESNKIYTCLKDITFCLIATAGGDINDGLSLTDDSFRIMSEFTNTPYKSLLIPLANDCGDIENNSDIKQMAKDFAEKLITS
ncbi:MAG: flavodoxin family protein [Cyanobacteriota bacterium]